MELKFAANLAWLFKDAGSICARYAAAQVAGFSGVEFPLWPGINQSSLAELVEAKQKSGLEQVLVNALPGDQPGDQGIAALPTRQKDFRRSIEATIHYAKALNCNRVHVMAGVCPPTMDRVQVELTYIENISWAARRLQEEGMQTLIEPINNRSLPDYFLNSYEKAVDYIEKIKNPNLKLQLDTFHLQIIAGDLTSNIKWLLPYVGHIQIAQVPARHEPDSSGEINYSYVFQLLQELQYSGWIGCEYQPSGGTIDGLRWLKDMAPTT
ncbi:PREDICTED: putative hydroxypyruvate isomerase [Priapulus caudatus]|uniref:Putative hydroxypyruvate isomerase n=1 Tax=Priapulus caudatus TaxID=37621 RepID=A0ABM1DTS5_PRICU|nr:PREDICTED: putative hydroxypyruvate isomerase [Priapulus caudatus]